MEILGQGSGTGKILLFGEHAAVYGYPALGLSLPWTTTVKIAKSEKRHWEIPLLAPSQSSQLLKLIHYLEKTFPAIKKLGALKIMIESDIPMGVGFGSSAALCVAMVKAGLSLIAEQVIQKTIGRSLGSVWELAHRAEQLFHGRPSGIDTCISLMGNLRSFKFTKRGLPQNSEITGSPFYLVVGAIPRVGNTGEHIKAVAKLARAGDKTVRKAIAELGAIASQATQLLKKYRTETTIKLGELANIAQEILCQLNLSTELLERILKKGIAAGATGGKLSGSGGGGAFYLFARSLESAREIAMAVGGALSEIEYPLITPVSVLERSNNGAKLILV